VTHPPKTTSSETLPVEARKPYRAPELVRWGDLQALTLTAGKSAPTHDGGAKWQNKQTS
jgi:hypothetical protein